MKYRFATVGGEEGPRAMAGKGVSGGEVGRGGREGGSDSVGGPGN